MDAGTSISLVGAYAERLHERVGDRHHVASPIGAWLLLALCAPLVEEDRPGALADVVGPDPRDAARFAAALLRDPHPLVAAAAAAWSAPSAGAPRLRSWLEGLPDSVAIGNLPTQAQADAWARARSLGLIASFPLELERGLALLLASVVATKVSWEVPFDVVAAGALDPSPWASQVATVLRAPADPRHRQFLARSDRAGVLGVHLAEARDGLLVGSVIAVDPDAAPADVLGAAYSIVTAETRSPSPRWSLFDGPLADGPVLSVVEEPVSTTSPGGREERFVSFLPAWQAQSALDLFQDRLGFPRAAAALAAAAEPNAGAASACQAAMARYSAVGFEAAAATALAVTVARRRPTEGLRRTATLRFGHPYAVVAACQQVPRRTGPAERDPWAGLPVFSAWVKTPRDA